MGQFKKITFDNKRYSWAYRRVLWTSMAHFLMLILIIQPKIQYIDGNEKPLSGIWLGEGVSIFDVFTLEYFLNKIENGKRHFPAKASNWWRNFRNIYCSSEQSRKLSRQRNIAEASRILNRIHQSISTLIYTTPSNTNWNRLYKAMNE